MKSVKRREFLLLADHFNADKHDPIGMIGSEKLDGNRCLWDGGVSRGDDTVNVPWAGILNPKTGELKTKIKPKATGLWSRYGNPIQAPDWFLDQLPRVPLDGELYAGRGNFQLTQKIVRLDDPNAGEWDKIQFTAFGAPTYESIFQSGLIKIPNMLCEIYEDRCKDYIRSRGFNYYFLERPSTYAEELADLQVFQHLAKMSGHNVLTTVDTATIHSMEQLDIWTKQVCANGGEGIILRDPNSVWYPKRRPFLLKCKPRHDAEATIVGFIAGRKGKTGQFLGKLGALVCRWHGDPTAPCGLLKAPVEFEIGTGLTHADRELDPVESFELACENPGKPLDLEATQPENGVYRGFRIGDRVTFSYMDVTKDLRPREPAYLRLRDEE